MALSRDFQETVLARARRDGEFRRALLWEGLGCLVAGEVEVGMILVRDWMRGTIGSVAFWSRKTEHSER